jgi:hypothetical protein
MEDGWIVDDAGNLLVWVPKEYRNALKWARGVYCSAGTNRLRWTFAMLLMGRNGRAAWRATPETHRSVTCILFIT